MSETATTAAAQAPAAPISAVVDDYFAMWNATDPDRRAAAITAAWSPDAKYVDPMFAAEGHAALDEMVTQVHEQFPGYRFHRTGQVEAHHDRARWSWELGAPDGSAAAAGVDFAILAPDGRFSEVTGFIEQQPGA
jgi:SnoaL-like domain